MKLSKFILFAIKNEVHLKPKFYTHCTWWNPE